MAALLDKSTVGPPRSRLREQWPLLLLLIPLALVLVGFWPGHMSNDTLEQVRQSRTGELTNQHTPLLNAIWGVGWDLFNAGPGWILFLQNVAFLGGSHLLLRGLLKPLPAALGTVALALFPAVFGMLGYVSRDVWFTAGLLLTFGLVSLAGREQGRTRQLAAAGAILMAFLTCATRQNAAPALWPALILLATLALPFRRAVLAGSALTVALVAAVFLATAPLDVADNAPQEQLYAYDLAALSIQDGENLFPRSIVDDQSMAPVQERWNVDTVGPFVFAPTQLLQVPLPDDQSADLSSAWRDAITGDPVGYLEQRTTLFLRQLSITRDSVFIYHPQIDANPFGFQIRFPDANAVATDYVEAFAETPSLDGGLIHAIWIYLLICFAATVVLLRRNRSWALLTLGAAAFGGGIAYQSGLFFGAMATQYRWEWPVTVCALLALPALVVALRRS